MKTVYAMKNKQQLWMRECQCGHSPTAHDPYWGGYCAICGKTRCPKYVEHTAPQRCSDPGCHQPATIGDTCGLHPHITWRP